MSSWSSPAPAPTRRSRGCGRTYRAAPRAARITRACWRSSPDSAAPPIDLSSDAAEPQAACRPPQLRAEVACGECGSKLAPGVVDGLVDRAARHVEPVGEEVDRDVVESYRDEDLALMRAEVALDPFADSREELRRLGLLLRHRVTAGYQIPALGLEWQLASLPGTSAHRARRLEQRKLVGPGREAALAPELSELAQHRHKRVVGALLREVVVIVPAQVPKCDAPTVDLETRPLQQQGMQSFDRRLALGTIGTEPLNPAPRLRIKTVGVRAGALSARRRGGAGPARQPGRGTRSDADGPW